MHGGRSTGPRTVEGLARSRRARWKHGDYSVERVKERRAALDRAGAELWDEWAVSGAAMGFIAVPVRYRNVAGVQLLGTALSRQDLGPACMIESLSVKRRFRPSMPERLTLETGESNQPHAPWGSLPVAAFTSCKPLC